MTVKQAAKALSLGINSTYELIHQGELNSLQVGRKILVPKVYLIDYINEKRYNKGA